MTTSSGKHHIFRRWRRDRRGVAASEFALILPVMLALLIGAIEIGNALLIDRKVTAAIQTGADLVAQAETMPDSEMADIFEAMMLVLQPFDETRAGVTVYSVNMDADGNVAIDWSETQGANAPTPTTEIPDGLLHEGESVIVAEMNYMYTPIFADLVIGEVELGDKAYLRPRRTRNIARTVN